jgi:hypothetical protein
VGEQIDLLQGTLDMLILKAVSLGPLHGYGYCSASGRFLASSWRSRRDRCTSRSTDWNTRA